MLILRLLKGVVRTSKLLPNVVFTTSNIFLDTGYVAPRFCSSSATSDIASSRILNSSDEPIVMANPFEREKPKCILCRMNIHPNYKNVRLLSQFQSPYTGRIYGRHITGLCKMQQDRVEQEIMRSHRTGYMGSYNKGVEFLQDPKLFDPERPIRPHNY